MLVPMNIRHQNIFSSGSQYVLNRDQEMYADTEVRNKLDKEQLAILERKLERYGFLNKTKELIKQNKAFESEIEKATSDRYIPTLTSTARGLLYVLRQILLHSWLEGYIY